MRKFLLGLGLLGIFATAQADTSLGQKYGTELGNAGIGAASGSVSAGTGTAYLPGYSTKAKEEQYYQDGMGNINVEGYAKAYNCANANANLTADQKIECEAINFVSKNPKQRKLYEVDPKTDSVIKSSNEIKENTATAFNNNQTCFQKTVKVNPVYEEEQCIQGTAFSEQQCLETIVNDVCPVSVNGNICNGDTGIDKAALITSGDHNSYIRYENNKLKFGLGYSSNYPVTSATSSFKVTIRNRAKLRNIKLVASIYDDAYLLKINGVEALAVNIGGAGDNAEFSSNKELGEFFVEGENTIELTVYNNVRNTPYRADLTIDIPLYCECTKKKTNTCDKSVLENNLCRVKESICTEQNWKGECVKKQLNYFCKNTMYNQQTQSCQSQNITQCKNPGGVLRDISSCDEGVDYDSLKLVKDSGNASFNKTGNDFVINARWDGTAVKEWEVAFNIKNVSKMNMFLKSFHYDNQGIVYVNGTEVVNKSTNSNATYSPNLDLKPWLKNGTNTIRMYINNWAGPGAGILTVSTNYMCSCSTEKVDTCTLGKTCKLLEETCTDESTKLINGVMVKGCWNSTKKYTCEGNGTTVSDCRPLLEKGCTQIGSECTAKDAKGTCLSYSQKYQCEKTPGREEQKTICADVDCVGDECFKQEKEDDQDFAEAVTMMEVAREAGVYGDLDPNGLVLFKGEENSCTVKLLAGSNIMSCCKEAKINPDVASNKNTGSTATDAYGNNPSVNQQKTQGSTYQYDDMYNDDKLMKQLQAQLTLGWLECKGSERELSVKRGSSLCTHARTWCSDKKPLIGCIEETRAYCCFKSILAKILNRQGRAQLGLSLETCAGITVTQLQSLDFSKIDLTEFKNSITPTNLNLDSKISDLKKQVQKQAVGGYYSE